MSKVNHNDNEMREEYDFSQGIRGKHYQAYRAGHVVTVTMNKVIDEVGSERDDFSREAANQTLRRTE